MNFPVPRRLFVIAALLCCLAVKVHARGCWRGGVLTPRRYHYLNRWHGSRDAFDLVSDMMSVPIYFKSLVRQQDHQLARSAPNYTVSRGENGVVELSFEIPGVAAKDLSVELEDGNLLRIRGKRRWSEEHGSETETEFDRVFRLDDDIDVSNIQVSLSYGILRVRAPRKEKSIRKIQITTIDDDKVDVHTETALEEVTAGDATATEGLTITEEDIDIV